MPPLHPHRFPIRTARPGCICAFQLNMNNTTINSPHLTNEIGPISISSAINAHALHQTRSGGCSFASRIISKVCRIYISSPRGLTKLTANHFTHHPPAIYPTHSQTRSPQTPSSPNIRNTSAGLATSARAPVFQTSASHAGPAEALIQKSSNDSAPPSKTPICETSAGPTTPA